uniref:Uncharacterized protein n=1 Tax=Heterorhabditis bacteriophora TaxID=37862 RepID=A0A1I7X4K1_HETBA
MRYKPSNIEDDVSKIKIYFLNMK